MSKRFSILVLIPFTLVCSTASAQTHVFKVGGTGGLTSIQAAVDAAGDGDLILIRPGSYAAFSASGKSVSILPTPSFSVSISGECHVEALPTGRTMLVGGFSCTTASGSTSALVVRYNDGAIVLREAQFLGPAGDYAPPAVRLLDNDIVVANGCSFTGLSSGSYFGRGGTGMIARRSNFASYGSSFTGGNGGGVINCNSFYWGYDGADGGDGFQSPEGFLFAASSTFRGGNGGAGGPDDYDPFTGIYTPAGTDGDGGNGVFLGSLPPTVLDPHIERQQSSFTGGLDGGYMGSCGYAGSPGQGIKVSNGSVGTVTAGVRTISLQSLAYESSVIQLTASGASGERVYLMFSQFPDFQYDASLAGCRLLRQPMLASNLSIGTIPPSGTLQTPILLRRLPPSDETGTFMVQAAFVAPNGAVQLSNGTAIALVDIGVSLN